MLHLLSSAVHMMRKNLRSGDVRTVMHFHPAIAPVKVAVLPLSKKLSEQAEEDLYKTQQNI